MKMINYFYYILVDIIVIVNQMSRKIYLNGILINMWINVKAFTLIIKVSHVYFVPSRVYRFLSLFPWIFTSASPQRGVCINSTVASSKRPGNNRIKEWSLMAWHPGIRTRRVFQKHSSVISCTNLTKKY